MRKMTLAELTAAYKQGEHLTPMMIDNDSVSVTRVDEENDPDWRHAEEVFSMHPEDLLEQCLDLLGIPHGNV